VCLAYVLLQIALRCNTKRKELCIGKVLGILCRLREIYFSRYGLDELFMTIGGWAKERVVGDWAMKDA
jgi:hypothetical protein